MILDEKGYKPDWRGSINFKPIEYDVTEDGCWEVRGRKLTKKDKTYAVVTRNGRNIRLHRYVYQLYKGDIPKGAVIRHLCHNKSCINPDHLAEGTQKENIHDNYDAGLIYTGSKHGMSSLSREQYFHIKELLKQNLTLTEIAKVTDVGNRHIVSKIKKGTHWSCKEYE